MEYTGDIIRTFADDRQLQLSSLRRQSDEGIKDYFDHKLAAFSDICTDKRVLMVIDNFSGLISKDMSRMLDYGYDVIITTRNEPPKNSFASIEVTAIPDTAKLFELVSLNMGRTLVKVERECFEEIFRLVHGHTLTLELIARQINAGHIDVQAALELIRANGFPISLMIRSVTIRTARKAMVRCSISSPACLMPAICLQLPGSSLRYFL